MNSSKIDQLLNGFNSQDQDDPMVSKGFYLTPSMDKALALKAANDGLKRAKLFKQLYLNTCRNILTDKTS